MSSSLSPLAAGDGRLHSSIWLLSPPSLKFFSCWGKKIAELTELDQNLNVGEGGVGVCSIFFFFFL